MGINTPRITYDRHGTPGIWAHNPVEAYAGLGFVHGRLRPLQCLLVAAAGRGSIAKHLAPRADLVALDALVHRLDLPGRARAEAGRLRGTLGDWVDAYLAGLNRGLDAAGTPFELRLLLARLPRPDRDSLVAGTLLGAYLGLAEGQERMERALVDALAAGAEPQILEEMFSPHLDGWDPERLARLPRRTGPGFAAHAFLASGGSNAWAVTADRSASGKPLLCGDPHLQINQLPALFIEVRARVGDDLWLGASIPGLPALAVGRNRRLAWSGTFGVADNVDFFIEELTAGKARRGAGSEPLVLREAEIGRRCRRPLRLQFRLCEHGALEGGDGDGSALAVRWAGVERAGDTLAAFMELPLATSAAAAERVLERAGAFSLHFVLADSGGDVRYLQLGRVPRRSHGWSGLYPVSADGPARWTGFHEGAALPRSQADAGRVVTANEARPAPDGSTLSTLAQPYYRRQRIGALLDLQDRHDRPSMQAIQLDLWSLQAERLRGLLQGALPRGPLAQELAAWDGCYDASSRGAHAFDLAYRAALRALAPELGGPWLLHMLERSELSVWWADGFDRVLASPASWQGERGASLAAAVAASAPAEPRPWGEVQRFTLSHQVLGGLPTMLGFDRGPFALTGSIATVKQGNLVPAGGRSVAVGPAYRMICDLADEAIWTSLPGGIDGSRFGDTYDYWLDEYLRGGYHRLVPPEETELG